MSTPEAFSEWGIAPATGALIEHNGTGVRTNYSADTSSATDTWANRTLNVSNTSEFTALGPILVSNVYVQNATLGIDMRNSTGGGLLFTLYGRSNVSEAAVPQFAYIDTPATALCRARDFDTAAAINDLTISFFDNRTGAFGSGTDRQSNSSGWASHSLTTPSAPGVLAVKCNTTDDADVFYNDTANNALTATIDAMNLTMNSSIASSVTFGDNVTLRFDVNGNATPVTSTTANITFYNITDAGYRESVTVTQNASFVLALNATYNRFEINYTPQRSGNYTVLFLVNATGRLTNETRTFNVTFGQPVVEFENPFRLFVNQTFRLAVRVSAVNGDIWNVTSAINITNQTRMNVTFSTFTNTTGFNITSASSQTVTYAIATNATGFEKISFNATPETLHKFRYIWHSS